MSSVWRHSAERIQFTNVAHLQRQVGHLKQTTGNIFEIKINMSPWICFEISSLQKQNKVSVKDNFKINTEMWFQTLLA